MQLYAAGEAKPMGAGTDCVRHLGTCLFMKAAMWSQAGMNG